MTLHERVFGWVGGTLAIAMTVAFLAPLPITWVGTPQERYTAEQIYDRPWTCRQGGETWVQLADWAFLSPLLLEGFMVGEDWGVRRLGVGSVPVCYPAEESHNEQRQDRSRKRSGRRRLGWVGRH